MWRSNDSVTKVKYCERCARARHYPQPYPTKYKTPVRSRREPVRKLISLIGTSRAARQGERVGGAPDEFEAVEVILRLLRDMNIQGVEVVQLYVGPEC